MCLCLYKYLNFIKLEVFSVLVAKSFNILTAYDATEEKCSLFHNNISETVVHILRSHFLNSSASVFLLTFRILFQAAFQLA